MKRQLFVSGLFFLLSISLLSAQSLPVSPLETMELSSSLSKLKSRSASGKSDADSTQVSSEVTEFNRMSSIESYFDSLEQNLLLEDTYFYEAAGGISTYKSLNETNLDRPDQTSTPYYESSLNNVHADTSPTESTTPTPSMVEDDHSKQSYTKQFGYNTFRDNNTGYADTHISYDPNYRLGPGDTILIRTWGKLELSLEVTIDTEGNVFIPKVGEIHLAGVRLNQLSDVITVEMEKSYVNFELSATLSKLHHIKVFILGEANAPGAYTISGQDRLFSALSVSGGPKKSGSLRKIQLRKGDATISQIDLYDYLLKGDNSQDPKLSAFDTLFIPPIGPVIKIDGEVKRQGIFELNGEKTLYAAVSQLAGGVTGFSSTKRIQVVRISDNEFKTVLDVVPKSENDFITALSQFRIKDGDSVRIFPVSSTLKQYVQIEGNVERPGRYAFEKNLSLYQLIQRSEGLLPDTYTKRATIIRQTENGFRESLKIPLDDDSTKSIILHEYDIVKIFSNESALGNSYVSVQGAVKNPGTYEYFLRMTVEDLLYMAELDDYADISQVDVYHESETGDTSVQTIDLKTATTSIRLQPNDQVYIRYESQLSRKKQITLSGEVTYPGVYLFKEGDTLSSIIKRAGGLTSEGYADGAVFKRISVQKGHQLGQNKFFEDEKKRLIYDLDGLNNTTEATYLIYQDSISFLNKTLKESSGRIIIDLDKIISDPEEDLILEHGDTLYIPQTPKTVQITGGVQQPNSMIFVPKKNARFYIDSLGGYSKYADKRKIFIIRSNGVVYKKSVPIEPGDTIYVPENVKASVNWFKIFADLASVFYQVAVGISVID